MSLYINKGSRNATILNVRIGDELKRFMELVVKSQDKTLSTYAVDIFEQMFPGVDDRNYVKRMKAKAVEEDLTLEDWCKENFPQYVKLKSTDIHKLPTNERIEAFRLMWRFHRTTFIYNAYLYLEKDGQCDLSWSIDTVHALKEMKAFADAKGEKIFIAPSGIL